MAEPDTDDLVAEGWDVYDSDEERIGEVREVTASWIRVEGEVGASLYVPLTAVEAATGGEVRLDTPGSEMRTMGWDRAPDDSAAEAPLEDSRTA
ncbi:MAG TPA: hypothetical protein VGK63_02465 [Candidatus Limnocylindrales bacterium]